MLLAQNNLELEKLRVIFNDMFENSKELNRLVPDLMAMGKTKHQLASGLAEINEKISKTINGLKEFAPPVSPVPTLSAEGKAGGAGGAGEAPKQLSAASKPWSNTTNTTTHSTPDPYHGNSLSDLKKMMSETMAREIAPDRVEQFNAAFNTGLFPGTTSRQPSKTSWDAPSWAEIARS